MAAWALVAAAALAGASADLPVGEAECGQTTCPPDTYCSSYDSHCRPCSNLCNPLHHNFEPKTCQNNCQGHGGERIEL
ncbi:Period protein [Gryllus bimaculatus]|nr:Period protein [Gryllus bimaculatus]